MTLRPLARLALGAAATALVLAACGSSAATLAPPTLSASGASTAAPAAAPTAAPTATPAPTAAPATAAPTAAQASQPAGATDAPAPSDAGETPGFSLPSEDKELEGRLPSQINGTTLTKYSFSGATFIGSGSGSEQVLDLLAQLGKTPADMSVALATDATNTLELQIGVFRVRGAPADALLAGFISTTKKDSPESTFSEATIGGKNVTEIADPSDPTTGTAYIYATGDMLFYVVAQDPALAATALQALP